MTGRRGPRHNPQSERSMARGIGFTPIHKVSNTVSQQFNPPAKMEPAALTYWKAAAPTLHERGLLNEANIIRFVELCETQARFETLSKEISKEGVVYKTATGNMRPNPKVKICERMAARVLTLEREFCLTPASVDRAPLRIMQFDPDYDPFAIE